MIIKYTLVILIVLLFTYKANGEDKLEGYKTKFDSLLVNNIDELFVQANSLKQASKDNGNIVESALADFYIGLYYTKISVYSKALNYYFKSLNTFQETDNKALLVQLYSSIGATYRHLKDYHKAKHFVELAYSNSSQSDDKVKAKILNRLGDMHRDLGNIDSAFIFYRNSLSITDIENLASLADNYNNIGDLYMMRKMYDSSLYYYDKSIYYLSKTDDKGELAENYTSIAMLNFKHRKYDQAIKNITQSIEILESIPPIFELNNAYSVAIDIYKFLDKKDSLSKYLFKLIKQERNTAKEQLDKTVLAIELDQTLKAKEMEFELLKQQSQLKDRINFLLFIVIALVIIAGILLWRQITLKKKENKLLAEQNETIRLAKEELQTAYNNIHELNATKDKFFSIIAHDLRNPIGSFKMVVSLLYDSFTDLTTDEKKEFIGLIKNSADNLHSLLENLLEWSRSQRGQIKFEPTDSDMFLIAENTIGILKTSADNKSIKLENNFEKLSVIFADRNLLTIVVRNLVSNAIKFTNVGGVVSIGGSKSSDGRYQIYVRDNGIGMGSATIEKLFKLEKNISSKGTANEDGTGLGLLLCKEFIEKHNGKIWVVSELNKGSVFYIELPPQGYKSVD